MPWSDQAALALMGAGAIPDNFSLVSAVIGNHIDLVNEILHHSVYHVSKEDIEQILEQTDETDETEENSDELETVENPVELETAAASRVVVKDNIVNALRDKLDSLR